MQPDTVLSLGDFNFGASEVPQGITFGGTQRLAVHELVGGIRVIDAMGRSDKPLEWSGWFIGAEATQRAQFLDTLRVQGQPQLLSWAQFSYQIIVRSFEADYQRFYQIPYRITCEVIQDLTTPVTDAGDTPIDDAISADYEDASALSDEIDDDTLSGLMSTLGDAISDVATFVQAGVATIGSILQPLVAVQTQVESMIATVGSAISSMPTFGGVIPFAQFGAAAESLALQTSDMLQAVSLYNLRNLLGRMAGNLAAVNAAQNAIAVAGGNLFRIAEQQYGDATAWTGIAKANGLSDPFVQGAQTLTIPPQPDQQDGVLTA